jgi:gliding motility-associated-like protein
VPHVTTTYWVMVRNDAGTCIDRDSVTIKVKCDDIYMPNAFYPENNATSDYTRLFGPRNVSLDLKYFRIFNRWGQQVFQTNNIRDRWDGTFKGVAQPSGNYVWIIEGNCPNGEAIHKTGNVFLAR